MTTMDEEAQGPVKLEIHSRETLCRVCACNTELLIPIFDGEGLENNIPEKLDRYLPIQVTQSDVLPVQICFQCASTVISWHELSTTCIEAEQKLKAMFGSDLEVNTSDDQHSVGIVEQGVESNSSKDAGQERFIADVSEDDSVVCLEVQDKDKLSKIERLTQIDHSYTRGNLTVVENHKKSQQEESNREVQRPHRSKTPRPVLPRPRVSFVSQETVLPSHRSEEIKQSSRKLPTKPIIVVYKGKNHKPVIQCPDLVPFGIQKRRVYRNIIPKPTANEPLPVKQSSSKPSPSSSKPIQIDPPLLDPLSTLPKLKELTITRVPSENKSKKTSPMKTVPKASVTLIRGGVFACKSCPAKFTNEVVFKRHMYVCHNIKKFMCPMCRGAFGTKFELDSHIRHSHRPKPKHICKFCCLSFEKVMDLRCHIRDKHVQKISRFEQVLRDKKPVLGVPITEKEAIMLKEIRTVVDGKDVFHCIPCNRKWSMLEKAVSHVRTHTKELLYSCETCGNRFNTRGVLQRHFQVHSSVKPFSCEYCKKTFASKQNRDDHHRLHTKEVKTVCESCGEFLTSASMLYYHRKIHSGVNPYKCPYCDKAYSIRSLLKRHIRFHTGEKPHLCSVCGRSFKTSGQLRGHSAVHSDERPFSCEGCGAAMKTKKYLNRHKAICAPLQSIKAAAKAVEAIT